MIGVPLLCVAGAGFGLVAASSRFSNVPGALAGVGVVALERILLPSREDKTIILLSSNIIMQLINSMYLDID